MKKQETRYTIKVNHSAHTYTIRRYDNGKLTVKYRSNEQSKDDFCEDWTESDIKNFLRSNDYYRIK